MWRCSPMSRWHDWKSLLIIWTPHIERIPLCLNWLFVRLKMGSSYTSCRWNLSSSPCSVSQLQSSPAMPAVVDFRIDCYRSFRILFRFRFGDVSAYSSTVLTASQTRPKVYMETGLYLVDYLSNLVPAHSNARMTICACFFVSFFALSRTRLNSKTAMVVKTNSNWTYIQC